MINENIIVHSKIVSLAKDANTFVAFTNGAGVSVKCNYISVSTSGLPSTTGYWFAAPYPIILDNNITLRDVISAPASGATVYGAFGFAGCTKYPTDIILGNGKYATSILIVNHTAGVEGFIVNYGVYTPNTNVLKQNRLNPGLG